MRAARRTAVLRHLLVLVLADHAPVDPTCTLTLTRTRTRTLTLTLARWIRPELQANASGFYANVLAVKRYWDAELAAEGMMHLALPAAAHTNGSWLAQQARSPIVGLRVRSGLGSGLGSGSGLGG